MRRLALAVLLTASTASAQTPGELPAGPGRAETVRVCTGCHEAEVLIHRSQKHAAWSDVVQAMVEKGAEASSAEQTAIVAYLQKALPPQGSGGR
ncbi:MAG: hypothetical protein C0481_13570 [Phenylobacterium sp.]|uniref:hypothetical protein n=1 Tax=Phenylobacterium sp. TaxID=1871053 RepID=UPI0025CC96A1|nr:hypothetical protein [Phenylobacterium sp.]MBA4012891.1 hypothetical protein [Phenylobacterium sp.]